jgi:hypothetical protein
MMEIHSDIVYLSTAEQVQGIEHQRSIQDWDRGLRKGIGQRPKASS